MTDIDNEVFGPEALDATREVSAGLSTASPSKPLSRRAAVASRTALDGLQKYVQGALVAPQGPAGLRNLGPLVRRMAAVGLVGAMSIVVPDHPAQAWTPGGYGQPGGGPSAMGAAIQAWRQRRAEVRYERQQQNQQLLAAGAGLVGGLAIGSMLRPGYSQPSYPAYPNYQAAVPYGQPAYGAYGGYGPAYGSGYGSGYGAGRAPSDAFTLAAKTLIAARINSVNGADHLYDRALRQAAACVQSLGPAPRCVANFQGVTLDLGRGVFVASLEGQPVVAERGGLMQQVRPDILADARRRALDIKAEELGMNGRGFGY